MRVVVQDVNDHSPVFSRQSYSATVVENTPVGTVVLQAVATDQDEGLNAKIRSVVSLIKHHAPVIQ